MENLKNNKQLMTEARMLLAGRWKQVIGVIFFYSFIFFFLSLVFKLIFLIVLPLFLPLFLPLSLVMSPFVIVFPMSLGLSIFFLNFTRKLEVSWKQLFKGYSYFFRCIKVFLLVVIYTCLWFLLLVIPGILAVFNYSLIYFIFIDNPEMSGNEMIKESKRLMVGNRWKLYCLGWRFLGWFLLSILTLGIGLLWYLPYVQVSFTLFYEDVKNQDLKKV